ncbi:MAG: hypothetical protein ACKOA2_02655, partial [Ilumatobacteraceae bacterium]
MRDWGASVAQRIALRFQVLRCIVFAVVAGLLAAALPVPPARPADYLTVAGAAPTPLVTTALTAADVTAVRATAASYWPGADLTGVVITITDLPDGRLAREVDGAIELDTTAAGRGWWTNPSLTTAVATDRIDLLTVMAHEFGHVLGLEDIPADITPASLMTATLEPGVRRLAEVRVAVAGTASVSQTGSMITAVSGAKTTTLDAALLAKLELAGSTGNDVITLSNALTVPLVVFGGGGADSVIGSATGTTYLVDRTTPGSSGQVSLHEVDTLTGGAATTDTVVLPASGATIRLNGANAGSVLSTSGATLVTYTGVEQVQGGDGADTVVTAVDSSLGSLILGATDRYVIDIVDVQVPAPTPAEPDRLITVPEVYTLTVGSMSLASGAALEVRMASGTLAAATLPTTFEPIIATSFTGTPSLRGLDLGGGLYGVITTSSTGIDLGVAALPDGLVAVFDAAADADRFFAFLGGATTTFGPVPVALDIGGQRLSGRVTVSGTTSVVTLTMTDLDLRLGDETRPLFRLADGDATLTLSLVSTTVGLVTTTPFIAGSLSGNISSYVAGVSVSGSFTVTVDTNAPRPISVAGTGVTLSLGGQRVTGGLTFTRLVTGGAPRIRVTATPDTTVSFGGASSALVTASLKARPIAGSTPAQFENPWLEISVDGVSASMLATVAVEGGDVVVSGDVSVVIDTTLTIPVFQVSASNLNATIGSRSFSGTFSFDELDELDAAGAKQVRLAVSGLGVSLGSGAATISNGAGSFVISSTGLTGRVSASASLAVGGLSLSAGTAALALDTTGSSNQLVIEITNAAGTVTTGLGAFGFSGTVLVDVARVAGADRVAIGVADLSLGITSGSLAGTGLYGAEGAFLATTTGLAGVLSGRASVASDTVDVGARIGLRINTTGAAVTSTDVTVGGRTFTIVFASGSPALEVFGTVSRFSIGSFLTVEGDVTFSGDVATIAAGTVLFVGEGPANLPDGSTANPAARGLRVVVGVGGGTIKRIGAGYALSIAGSLGLVGVPSVRNASATNATVRVNTTGAAQEGFTGTDDVYEVGVTSAELDLGVLHVTAGGTIRRTTTASGLDALALSTENLAFTAKAGSSTAVAVTNGSGVVLFTSTGATASLSANAAVGGRSLSGHVEFNTTGAAIDERVGSTDL